MDGMSLLDVLRSVMLDPAEQAAYSADPSAYLERFGYDHVDPADLSEAFGLVADTLPPAQAQAAWDAAGTGPFGAPGAHDPAGAGYDAHELDAHDLDAGRPDAPLSFGSGDPFAGHAPLDAPDAAPDHEHDQEQDDGGGLALDLDGDGRPDDGVFDEPSPFEHAHGALDHHDVFDHHDLADDGDGPGDHGADAFDHGADDDDFDRLDGYGSLDDDGPDVGSF